MSAPRPLDRLQRWMQAVIVDPGTSDAAADAIAEVVLPSARLCAAERVGLYRDMYLLRMEEALAADYPGLKHLLGADGFFALVRGYLREYPSRHFSLSRLGDHVPPYVSRAPGLRRRAFCHDLARLELALTRVFDAPQTPAATAEEIASVAPERWEGARLVPIAASALLAFRHPVGAYLDSVGAAEGHEHPPLRRKDTWAVVYRKDYSVWRQDLDRAGYRLLADLAAGRTVGEAVSAAMRLRGRDRPTERRVFRLFRDWAAAGLFQRVDV